jgi:hypothetical protein
MATMLLQLVSSLKPLLLQSIVAVIQAAALEVPEEMDKL